MRGFMPRTERAVATLVRRLVRNASTQYEAIGVTETLANLARIGIATTHVPSPTAYTATKVSFAVIRGS